MVAGDDDGASLSDDDQPATSPTDWVKAHVREAAYGIAERFSFDSGGPLGLNWNGIALSGSAALFGANGSLTLGLVTTPDGAIGVTGTYVFGGTSSAIGLSVSAA